MRRAAISLNGLRVRPPHMDKRKPTLNFADDWGILNRTSPVVYLAPRLRFATGNRDHGSRSYGSWDTDNFYVAPKSFRWSPAAVR